ncbi:sensor histidine kinase [Glaciecola sp. MF2-115]|uniref:sensor histidine kinase n=1 Tax=Glaciecola sp. MF2-115 TaxID=3384827 RepID=UPI0039A1EF93
MTNSSEKPRTSVAHVATYATLVMVGLLIVVMLVVEHNQAKSLVQDNQVLMRDIVLKTMQSNISNLVAEYPLDKTDIENNWLTLEPNFEAYKDSEAIYPYRFNGTISSEPSELWHDYRDAIDDSKQSDLYEKSDLAGQNNLSLQGELSGQGGLSSNEGLSSHSLERIKALIALKNALASSEPEMIRQSIDKYFTHVQNYQLSVLEEIVSALSFLRIDKTSRWNDVLIEQILKQQSPQPKPLFDYLFKQNKRLNSADLRKALENLKEVLAPTAIDQTWFEKNARALWQENRQLPVSGFQHFTIIDHVYLVLKPNDNITLVLPFNIQVELQQVQTQLIEQGVLDVSDQIEISHLSDTPSQIHLSELAFDINRKQWQEQIQRQRIYFVAKLIATSVLIMALLILARWIASRQQKKLEYIQMREGFVNLVSHELKTPLASIRIMIETLQKRNERALSIKDYPEKIIAEVDQLWMMVDNLLSMNHIKSKELILNLEPCNLYEIVERVRLKLKENDSIVVSIDNKIPTHIHLELDVLLFELVLVNLISNAVKYCDKDVSVIELDYDLNTHCLFFQDNACGIAQENWKRVFDDFFREDKQLSRQGTGIGLSLCQQILKLHNASISIQESSNKGTLWCMDLSQLERNRESDT